MLLFNNSIVSQSRYQKHLVIFLDVLLTFEEHLKVITTKVNETIGVLRKLHKILPRPALMTLYKAFVRPHIDYGYVIYDEAYNETFHQKLESIGTYKKVVKRKPLPRIRLRIPLTSTLAQETVLLLQDF